MPQFCYQWYINKVEQNEKLSKIYSNLVPLGGTLSSKQDYFPYLISVLINWSDLL